MEKWQVQHITTKFPSLLRLTIVNEPLLAKFRASGLLSDYDVQQIKAVSTSYDRTVLLYEILLTRADAYKQLLEALQYTCQTGAIKVLVQIPLKVTKKMQISFLGKVYRIKDILNTDQIEAILHWVNTNGSWEERIEMYENIFRQNKTVQLLRDTIPPRKFLYYPRCIVRQLVVTPEIFKKKCSDVFVFKDAERSQIRNFVTSHAIVSSTTQLLERAITAKFIILDSESDWNGICRKTQHPVHLLRYEQATNTFVMEKTSGGSSLLRKHTQKEPDSGGNISEKEIVETLTSGYAKGICICDSPGMGKSLLLANLAAKICVKYSERIVAFIQLRNFEQHIQSGSELCPKLAILKYISTSALAYRILFELVESTNTRLELFFDGLDEVNESNLEITQLFLLQLCETMPHTRVYVTSRPVVRYELEKTLSVIAYDIEGFSEQTQRSFLTAHWAQQNTQDIDIDIGKLNDYAEICIESMKNVLKDTENKFTGIPLLCRLLREVYADEAAIYADKNRKISVSQENFAYSLSEVYSRYMVRQFRHTRDFECRSVFTNCIQGCRVKRFHSCQALKLIFPGQKDMISSSFVSPTELSLKSILTPGILEKDQENVEFEFVHRTFAEFLVAEFLAMAVFTNPWLVRLYFRDVFKIGNNKILHGGLELRKFREDVVAYFLNDMLRFDFTITRVLDTEPWISIEDDFFMVFDFLMCCVSYNFDGLLELLIHSTKRFPNMDLFCDLHGYRENILSILLLPIFLRKTSRDYYVEEVTKKAIKIFQIAALKCSMNTIEKVQTFFVTHFEVNVFETAQWLTIDPTPLQIAVQRAEPQVALYFKEKMSIKNQGLMYLCVKNTYFEDDELVDRRLDIAKVLFLECKHLIYESWKNYKSPLLVEKIHLKAVYFLVENGASVKIADSNGQTVLYSAADYMSEKDFLELADFLFKRQNAQNYFLDPQKCTKIFGGLHPENKYHNMRTLLRILRFLCNTPQNLDPLESSNSLNEILKSFLNTQTTYNKYKEIFKSVFLSAVVEGEEEIAQMLYSYDNTLIKIRHHGMSFPILLAAEYKQVDIVKCLVSKGANIFATGSMGRTILHLSAEYMCCESFHKVVRYVGELLLSQARSDEGSSNSANQSRLLQKLFNCQTSSLETPLHYAVKFLSDLALETLKWLLYYGCNSDGQTLEAYQRRINATDAEGNTVLHLALHSKQSLDLVKYLISVRGDWSLRDKYGRNVAHISALACLPEHLKYFVQLGCDVNQLDTDGNNVLQSVLKSNWTSHESLLETMKLLLNAGVNTRNKNLDGKLASNFVGCRRFPKEVLEKLSPPNFNDSSLQATGDSSKASQQRKRGFWKYIADALYLS